MPNRVSRRLALAVSLLPLLAGCEGDSPTGPDRGDPRLGIFCLTPDSRVACSATLYDVPVDGAMRDVTQEAKWLASSSVGQFYSPGIFTPTRPGEVEIRAVFSRWESPPFTFLVDPSRTSRWLYFLSGVIRDEETNQPIPGVKVEIVSGYARGAQATTNENGHYRIDKVLTGETFTAQASKPGYSSSTHSYRVDPPQGSGTGNAPFLDFRLRRLPNP